MGSDDKIEPNPSGEVELLGFAAGLNEAGTEAEYLGAIAAMCGLDLDQSVVLTADWSSMAMLHGSVKTVLRNATCKKCHTRHAPKNGCSQGQGPQQG